jgi:hypothetical protein
LTNAHDRAAGVASSGQREDEKSSQDGDQRSIAELLAREQRGGDYHRGIAAGRRLAISQLLDQRRPTQLFVAMQAIAAELKLQRAAAESLGGQADFWRVKFLDALKRVIELARELDKRAPGWDA